MTKTASNEALGAVLSGMIAFDQGITNNLIDAHLDAAISWARKFENLYQRVEYALESGNAVAAYHVLGEFGYDYDCVPSKVDHYQSLKMGSSSHDRLVTFAAQTLNN